MTEDDEPKSALELAMERLRKKDAESGAESRPLTDAQRASIAEVRNFYEAKAAEVEVLHQSALRRALEPDARACSRSSTARPRAPQSERTARSSASAAARPDMRWTGFTTCARRPSAAARTGCETASMPGSRRCHGRRTC